MKTGAKWALGVLAALLMVCILSVVLLFGTRGGRNVQRFGTGMVGFVGTARSLESIEKKRTFTPPADGLVREDRLRAYLAVSEAIKPLADRYAEWIAANAGRRKGHGDFAQASQAIDLMGSLMKRFATVLDEQAMGTREWAWIGRTMRRAALGLEEKKITPLDTAMLQTLEEAASKPGLSDRDRRELQAKVDGFRREMDARGGPPDANEALYLKYSDRLRACALSDESRALVGGFGGDVGSTRPSGDAKHDREEAR